MEKSPPEKWSITKLCTVLPYKKPTVESAIAASDLKPKGMVKGQNPYPHYEIKEVVKACVDYQVEKALAKAKPKVTTNRGDGDLDTQYLKEKLRLTTEQADKLSIQNGESRQDQLAKSDVKASLQLLLQSLAGGIDDLAAGIKSVSPEWNNKALRELEKWRIEAKESLVSFRVKEQPK